MTTWLPFDPPRQAPPLLTAEETARLFRLDAKHIDKALLRIRARGVKGIRIGNQVLFPLAETLNFIERELQENPR